MPDRNIQDEKDSPSSADVAHRAQEIINRQKKVHEVKATDVDLESKPLEIEPAKTEPSGLKEPDESPVPPVEQ